MNELQRQIYLSALGVETYMPRWHLPCAPASIVCMLPAIIENHTQNNFQQTLVVESVETPYSQSADSTQTINTVVPVNSVINDIFVTEKVVKTDTTSVNATAILASLSVNATLIDGFSLSVWHPVNDLMIIDSRNTKLALPTELLLNNLLRTFFSQQVFTLKEEVLRWPMIENSFAKRTMDDACTELQTWLSVQCEISPIKYLWLMGANAATYFLPQTIERINSLWQSTPHADSLINALILPSLNELLQDPLQKKQLFSAIRRYHS